MAEQRLQEETGIRFPVAVVDPGHAPRSDGKAVRVLDLRPGSN